MEQKDAQHLESVAFLGPAGTHSDLALQQFCRGPYKPIACSSISEVFDLVASNSVSAGFVPLENMIQGPVSETLDLLCQYVGKLFISESFLMPIENAIGMLTAEQDLSLVTHVYSHHQPLQQCRRFLRSSAPNAECCTMPSTSAACQYVREHQLLQAAVIAPKSTLLQQGFYILADNIADRKDNKTRFAYILRTETGAEAAAITETNSEYCSKDFATSIAINPRKDRQGLLLEILQIMSEHHKVNLLSIHSRPDTKGGFVFHIDLEGALGDEAIRSCLESLKQYCERTTDGTAELMVFGSYKRGAFQQSSFRSIGILGGEGQMGLWFADFFRMLGYEVFVRDRQAKTTLREFTDKCDVIILSVPMSSVPVLADELKPLLRAGQLLVENCSIKNSSLPHLLRIAPDGVEVLGVHTMFAGTVPSLRGENVIFTRTEKSGEKAQALEDAFYKHGARVSFAVSEEHDGITALTQSLLQLNLLALAETMVASGRDLKDVEVFSTPNSRRVFESLSKVLQQKDELIVDLQTLNEQARKARHRFLEVIFRLISCLDNNDHDSLLQSVEHSRKYFHLKNPDLGRKK